MSSEVQNIGFELLLMLFLFNHFLYSVVCSKFILGMKFARKLTPLFGIKCYLAQKGLITTFFLQTFNWSSMFYIQSAIFPDDVHHYKECKAMWQVAWYFMVFLSKIPTNFRPELEAVWRREKNIPEIECHWDQ